MYSSKDYTFILLDYSQVTHERKDVSHAHITFFFFYFQKGPI